MRAVIQRVTHASVVVENDIVGNISEGLCVFLGIQADDSIDDIKWLCKKIVNLRIFKDSNGEMNLSLKELSREVLLISQFTLHANTKKGNRPSFIRAARADIAEPLYKKMKECLENEMRRSIATGIFGATMDVDLRNDGPVTIIIDTKDKDI